MHTPKIAVLGAVGGQKTPFSLVLDLQEVGFDLRNENGKNHIDLGDFGT